MKDQIIINYVSRLKKEYNIPIKESKLLLSRIQLGFQLKKLCSDDVCYSNREIQSINGLEYDSSKREWLITNTPHVVSKTDKPIVTQKFFQSIDRFLREYKNRHAKLVSVLN